jgi:hypothetical protein
VAARVATVTPFRILTWHVHGSYLDSLAQTGHTFLCVISNDDADAGRSARWPEWGSNVVDVAERDVPSVDVDLVLFQARPAWHDRARVLSAVQQRLPQVYLEHDPPRDSPTDERHWVDDPDTLLVHVSHFNELMWDAGRTPTRVIEHGIAPPDGIVWTGTLERGIVVINDLGTRGRRLGMDVFERARREIPLDLVGMHATDVGGLGEVRRSDLPAFEAPYRFFFHPIRWTSFGLALIEAMSIGMPIVALATTEAPEVLTHGVNAILSTDVGRLVEGMHALLDDRALAARQGAAAREVALERFSIARFGADWTAAFALVTGRSGG